MKKYAYWCSSSAWAYLRPGYEDFCDTWHQTPVTTRPCLRTSDASYVSEDTWRATAFGDLLHKTAGHGSRWSWIR